MCLFTLTQTYNNFRTPFTQEKGGKKLNKMITNKEDFLETEMEKGVTHNTTITDETNSERRTHIII